MAKKIVCAECKLIRVDNVGDICPICEVKYTKENEEMVKNNVEKKFEVKEEVTSDEIKELAENMGDSIEDVEELREQMVEDVNNELNNNINTDEEVLEMMIKINAGIKYAIKSATNEGRGIKGTQLKGIQTMYERLVGRPMLETQIEYLKTISELQAQRVMITLNVARKQLVNA